MRYGIPFQLSYSPASSPVEIEPAAAVADIAAAVVHKTTMDPSEIEPVENYYTFLAVAPDVAAVDIAVVVDTTR